MSRNFELLKQIELQQQDSQTAATMVVKAKSPATVPCLEPEIPAETTACDFVPHALPSPQIESLVQKTFFLCKGKPHHVVAFSEVERRVRPNFLCARAAEALALQRKGTVCVVDADFERPSIHKYFGLNNDRGLAQALRQPNQLQKFAYRLPHIPLIILPTGTGAEPQAVLTTGELEAWLFELRSEYDYVLIDSPPLRGYPIPFAIGRLTDGVVVIIEAHATRRDVAQEVKQELEAAQVPLIGAVLNNQTLPVPDAIYSRI